jgi:hypothetical protein
MTDAHELAPDPTPTECVGGPLDGELHPLHPPPRGYVSALWVKTDGRGRVTEVLPVSVPDLDEAVVSEDGVR